MSNLVNRDLYSEPMEEVEEIVKANSDHSISLNHYMTLSAIKGYQFGREMYTAFIPFKDLMKLLQVFPEVQRSVSGRKVGDIKRYVLSGIDDESHMRFFSGITVTCRGYMFYAEKENKVSLDTTNSKMSLNDGQHRFYGISEAIQELKKRINKSKEKGIKENYEKQLVELENMVIPLVIFNQISETEEKQLFHDLNNLAQRPSRSSTIRLAQTDLLSVMSREIAEENRYLVKYGVEYNKTSIHGNNKNTILLTTVYMFVKELMKDTYKDLNKDTYEGHKDIVNITLTNVFIALPDDITIKGKYMLDKHFALKGISKFIRQARLANIKDKLIFQSIKETDWSMDFESWKNYGAVITSNGSIQFGGSGSYGVQAVQDKLDDKLSELTTK